MSVQFSITVANAASLVAQGYTRIEVWCSSDLGNSYQEVTSSTATAASLTSAAASTTFDMNGGKVLKFKLDGGTEQTVTFSGNPVRYWTPTQVFNQINLVASGRASVSGSTVILTSSTTGRVSSVEITYDDTSLGWNKQISYGTDVRITLSGITFIYTYTDLAGATSNKYKWRFSANGVNPISEYSTPIYGNVVPFSVPISIGTATFVGLDGRPTVRSIVVAADDQPLGTSTGSIGVSTTQIYTSDTNGFIQIPFVQGLKVRLAIEGTAYVREIIIPSSSTFDILTTMATATDPFTIQVPPPYLTRRGP